MTAGCSILATGQKFRKFKLAIYKDMMLMNKFKREMKFMIDHPVVVTNPNAAFLEIVWGGNRVERERFYEIDLPVKITGTNSCEIIVDNIHENLK